MPSTLSLPDHVVDGIVELQAREISRLRVELSNAMTVNEALNAPLQQSGNAEILAQQLHSLTNVEMWQSISVRPHVTEQDLRTRLECAHIAFMEVATQKDVLFQEPSEARAARGALQEQLDRTESQLRDLSFGTSPEAGRGFQCALAALRQERDNLQGNITILTAELAGARDELAKCHFELEAARDREHDLRRRLAAHGSDVATTPSFFTMADENLPFSLAGLNYPEEHPDPSSEVHVSPTDEEATGSASTKVVQTMSLGNIAKIVKATFKPCARKYGFLKSKELKAALMSRPISISSDVDLVWDDCPNHAYIVKASRRHMKNGKWAVRHISAAKRLQNEGNIEVLFRVHGMFYYLGTFTCGEREDLSPEEFKTIPTMVRDAIVDHSCYKPQKQDISHRAVVREMYEKGRVLATAFPLQRVGYDSALQDVLLKIGDLS